MKNLTSLLTAFYERFGKESGPVPGIYFAPGRVNLIGEHTDYNGGFVLPCALQYGTYLVARKSSDGMIRLSSGNFPERVEIPFTSALKIRETRWVNYPLGVMQQFAARGKELGGVEMYFLGDIPNNAGLSSSASIEVATAFALNQLFDSGLEVTDLVHMSQQAEHEFAGVNCGIMDQFAVGMGAKNHAIFLNCRTLEYKLVPVLIPGYRLVVANTNKPRGLADSKYNERVAECQKAVEALGPVFGISQLGEVSYTQFFKLQDRIADEVIRKRARHVISENQRVLNAVASLLKSELLPFGALMNASHDSLRDNYEVTGRELDTLVDEARKVPGVIGARMTGAGFGGCTVNLMTEEAVERFMEQVGRE
ncbi:MAG TPA: galactokinase [Bacteroidales bacterium]|nr:galactokinase [Bacteroidales bacterium]